MIAYELFSPNLVLFGPLISEKMSLQNTNFFSWKAGRKLSYNNKKKKKKMYNAHVIMIHESEARAVARWPERSMLIVNELGYEVRLEVALETV